MQIYLIETNSKRQPKWEDKQNPPEELNEMEVSNLSEIDFSIVITRIFNSMKKDRENIKKEPIRNKECNI